MKPQPGIAKESPTSQSSELDFILERDWKLTVYVRGKGKLWAFTNPLENAAGPHPPADGADPEIGHG